jgi:hypothetical protein
MSNEKRTPPVKVVSPKGIAKFPWLNRPDTKFNPDGTYSVGVVVSKADAADIIAKLEAAATASFEATKADITKRMAEAKGEQKGKLKKELAELKQADIPVKPVYDEETGDETDKVELKFSMKAQYKDRKTEQIKRLNPTLVDAKGNPIPATTAIWAGSVIKVGGAINPYYTAKAGAGASLKLDAVKVYELVTSGGGSAAKYGFDKEEDGYEGTESDSPTPAPADPEDVTGEPDALSDDPTNF